MDLSYSLIDFAFSSMLMKPSEPGVFLLGIFFFFCTVSSIFPVGTVLFKLSIYPQ